MSVTILCVFGSATTAFASTATPLPESDYTVRHMCAPPAPGRASCLALALVPTSTQARTRLQQARAHPLVTRDSDVQTGLRTATECAEAFSQACLTPQNLKSAYFPSPLEPPEAPATEPQTIALVDAYNDPAARKDLEVYEREFGLSQCPASESRCFEQVNQKGQTSNLPFPKSEKERETSALTCEKTRTAAACEAIAEAEGWAGEIATDIEVARAICHNCKILLVEAESPEDPALAEAEETAAARATEVSNSWGGEEPATESRAFEHPGTVITASAGDSGYLNWTEAAEAEQAKEHGQTTGYFVGPDYPASSPHVIAVGGTRLALNSAGTWEGESVWNDGLGAGGGGCSFNFPPQSWQSNVPDWTEVGCGTGASAKRAVADVAADADPDTGVAVYDSIPEFSEEEPGKLVNEPLDWWPIGGTSVASPIIASMFALAGGAHGVAYPAQTLYAHLETDLLHPIASGGNGECDGLYTARCTGSTNPLSARFPFDCGEGALICNAAAGCEGHYYNGPTGVGTPNGVGAFKPEEHPAKDGVACATNSKSNGGAGGAGGGGEGGKEEPKEEPKSPAANGGPTVGASTGATSSQPTTVTSGQPSNSPGAPDSIPTMPVLSALTLTHNATAALSRGRLKVSRIAFAFRLNVAARVRVSLRKQVQARGGHKRWQTLPCALAIAAARGRDSAHLDARGTLAPGRYRLTLTPAGGRARTLTFQVG